MPAKQKNFLVVFILCTYAIFVMLGIRYAFGLYFSPIVSSSYLIDRQQFGNALASQNLAWGVAAFLIGLYYHRFSRLFLLFLGTISAVLGLLLLSQVEYAWELYLAFLLFSLGAATGGMVVSMEFISAVSPKGLKTYYMSIAIGVGSISFIFIPYLTSYLISLYGWEMCAFISITLPAIFLIGLFFLRDIQPKSKQQNLLSYKEALKSINYRYLLMGYFICGFHVGFITVYFPAYLHDFRMPLWLISISLSLIGLFNFVGSFFFGYMSKKYLQKNLLAIIYGLRVPVVLALLLLPKTVPFFILVASLFGLLWLATVPLTNGLVLLFFSQKNLARFIGFAFFLHQVGAFISIWLGGELYKLFGTYDALWWLDVILCTTSMILHLFIKETKESVIGS